MLAAWVHCKPKMQAIKYGCLGRRALWAGLLAACERVERASAASAERDPGILDWFGVSVKAAEIPAHLERMRVLARKARCPR